MNCDGVFFIVRSTETSYLIAANNSFAKDIETNFKLHTVDIQTVVYMYVDSTSTVCTSN